MKRAVKYLNKEVGKMSEKNLEEVMIKSEEVFSGVLLHIFRDEVKLPNGNTAIREYNKHYGAVCIIPVTDDGKVILERQFRYPIHEVITEIPAGKLDSPAEDPLDAAKRELREETGYTANTWISLGEFRGAAAYSNERIWMYMAKDLVKGERDLDDDEFLDVFTLPLEDAVKEVMDGTISDGKTISAVLKVNELMRSK